MPARCPLLQAPVMSRFQTMKSDERADGLPRQLHEKHELSGPPKPRRTERAGSTKDNPNKSEQFAFVFRTRNSKHIEYSIFATRNPDFHEFLCCPAGICVKTIENSLPLPEKMCAMFRPTTTFKIAQVCSLGRMCAWFPQATSAVAKALKCPRSPACFAIAALRLVVVL